MRKRFLVLVLIVLALSAVAMQDAAAVGGGGNVRRGAVVPILATDAAGVEVEEPTPTNDPCLFDFNSIYTPVPSVIVYPVDYGYPAQDYGYPVP